MVVLDHMDVQPPARWPNVAFGKDRKCDRRRELLWPWMANQPIPPWNNRPQKNGSPT